MNNFSIFLGFAINYETAIKKMHFKNEILKMNNFSFFS